MDKQIPAMSTKRAQKKLLWKFDFRYDIFAKDTIQQHIIMIPLILDIKFDVTKLTIYKSFLVTSFFSSINQIGNREETEGLLQCLSRRFHMDSPK